MCRQPIGKIHRYKQPILWRSTQDEFVADISHRLCGAVRGGRRLRRVEISTQTRFALPFVARILTNSRRRCFTALLRRRNRSQDCSYRIPGGGRDRRMERGDRNFVAVEAFLGGGSLQVRDAHGECERIMLPSDAGRDSLQTLAVVGMVGVVIRVRMGRNRNASYGRGGTHNRSWTQRLKNDRERSVSLTGFEQL